MKKFILAVPLLLLISSAAAQDSTPDHSTHYESVPAYPENFTTGSALARVIDGLGFRYYWVTHSLTPEDLAYRPSEKARSSIETLSHLQYMIHFMKNTMRGEVTTFPEPERTMSYEELRATTLSDIQVISDELMAMDNESIGNLQLKMKVGPDDMQVPFWHFLQGPIGDTYYHLGQIVSFRRTTGNPIDPTVQPFMGQRIKN